MILIRGFLAVILGYLVMAVVSMAVVGKLFADEGASPANRAIILSFLGLAIGAAVGGFLCTLIVGKANSPAIYIAIGIMFAVAARSFSLGIGIEPDWYRLASSIALAVGFLVGASAAAYKMDRR